MFKNSSSRNSYENKKIIDSLYRPSYSSLKPTIKPLLLRNHKSSEKRFNRGKENINDGNKQLELDARQKNNCFISFMKKCRKEYLDDMPSICALISIEENDKDLMKNSYDDPYLNILNCSNENLIYMSVEILGKFGLGEICGKFTLNKMIKEISGGYNVVSYHNFAHGFSLMHMFYHLTKLDKNFKNLLSKEEIGFSLLAGLAHDINHHGTNNIFEIKIGSEWAKNAKNEAVLEKMHIKLFFTMLKNKHITLLDKTKNPLKMKELVTRLILSTDVSKHFRGVEKLKSLRENGEVLPKDEEHKFVSFEIIEFILEQAFHACDIGNPCLEYKDYINWAALLAYEFNKQTKKEVENNIEVTEMLKYKGKKQFFQGQIGFISNFVVYLDALVLPIWKELTSTYPGFSLYFNNIDKNIEKLKIEIEEEEK